MVCFVDELKDYGDHVKDAARNPRYTGSGRVWCHLTSDSEAELHAFAARLRLSRSWAQHVGKPTIHYDLTPGKRTQAVRLGAVETTARERFGQLADSRGEGRTHG